MRIVDTSYKATVTVKVVVKEQVQSFGEDKDLIEDQVISKAEESIVQDLKTYLTPELDTCYCKDYQTWVVEFWLL